MPVTKYSKSKLYVSSLVAVAALTLLGMGLGDILTPIDQALIYLAGVVVVAAKLGRGPSFLYSLLSVTCFNFFFIPPIYTFSVYDRSYWLTFIVMLITSFVITNQASRLRLQAAVSQKREHETEAFYSLTRELASMRGHEDISNAAAKHIAALFGSQSMIGLPKASGQIQPIVGQLPSENSIKENSAIQWCFANSQKAGRQTTAMPSAVGYYFPLLASAKVGVLGIIPLTPDADFSAEELAALEVCASLLASALERANIAEIAQQSKIEAEREKLRTMLLSSVSHDLRTPLASIMGAASVIESDIDILPADTVRELGHSINREAERLSHLVSNLLEVTRLESGSVQLNRQLYFIEELIGSALSRVETLLSKHKVIPRSDEGLPMVSVDGVLIEQVLINLLENAVRYTPPGSLIEISAARKRDAVLVSVIDNGAGIPAGKEKKIFDKFYSIHQDNIQKGTGLGLAICATILKVHGTEIWAENLSSGGACFRFTLPVAEDMGLEDKNASTN